jgi:hypothetical protein
MTAPDPTQGQPAATAPASAPAAAQPPTPPQGQLADGAAPEKPVPYFRFAEVNTARAAAEARAQAAEARAAELERKAGRLELRADLGIDDDDDADRVRSAYEADHADVKPEKRPSVRDWLKAEGSLDKLPRSIRNTYGPAWVTPPQPQPQTSGTPQRQTQGQTPSTNRGAVTGASTPAALEDSARRTPRRPVR